METKTFLLRSLVVTFAALFVLVMSLLLIYIMAKPYINSFFSYTPFYEDGVCNVAVVPVYGDIGIKAGSMPVEVAGQSFEPSMGGDVDRIIADLEYIRKYSSVQAVVLQIDSYGGYGSGPETLLNYITNYPLPIVSQVREAADSGAYWVALGGERIFAQPSSEVGSIGVNMSLVNNSERNTKEGLEYVSITTGKYKDIGSPDKTLTDEEKEYLQAQAEKYNQNFKLAVATYRKIPMTDVEKIADGRSFIAGEARDLRLIDEVGFMEDVLKYLSGKLGTNAVVCESSSI
jgi:protease-4